MTDLAGRSHWDRLYEGGSTPPERPGLRGWRRLLGNRVDRLAANYAEEVCWRRVYERHVGGQSGARTLEIGAAPGRFLVRLKHEFGVEPFGVEYSAAGAETTRAVFAAAGADPRHVIHADFFDAAFLDAHRGTFDVVISRGFIEHFDRPADVVARHLELLRPGGLLIITIPNLSGINRTLTRFFDRELLDVHNLTIMRRAPFEALFRHDGLQRLDSGYCGGFSFSLFYSRSPGFRQRLMSALHKLQLRLNIVAHLLLRRRAPECRLWSANLFFVGRKSPAGR